MPIGLIVHGGAGLLESDDHAAVMAACKAAVEAGRLHLVGGGSALDAAEAAVRAMEANPLFNAGYGSVLNRDGDVEMDAMIIDGERQHFGSVCAVRRVQHPISLARYVLERTPHHMMAGAGAEQFAAEQGMPLIDPLSMVTERRRKQWEAQWAGTPRGADTVGAVALDSQGRIAVAVSTGGLSGKLPGRVGDSPVAGAGAYADNEVGGACATGVGEGMLRSLLSFRAVEAMRNGAPPQSTAQFAIDLFGRRFDGDGGVILIDRNGQVAAAHNSPFMPVAWMSGDKILAQVSAYPR